MKKLLFLMLAMAVAFSCQKKDQDLGPATADVVFGIQKVNPNDGLKATPPPVCPTDANDDLLEPAYAEIYITGFATPFSPTVFELDGMLYTQAIKLPAANGITTSYTVEDFLLYDANGDLIMATPAAAAAYSEYVTKTVPFDFDVEAFEKAEEPVEVLCYLPENYDYFGFTWFNITEIVVREFCFFGDICLNGAPYTPADFNGSVYGGGLGVDVPAIMKIVVKRDGIEVPNSPFKNVGWLGIGDPLCVAYPDRLNVQGEIFTFDLYVWVPDCNGDFDYRYFDTFTSTDDGALDPAMGTDNVLDYVIGTCGYPGADVTYGHYEWLAIQDFFDAPNGWLVTDDPSAGPIYRWNGKGVGTGSANIAPPIAYFLDKAGYTEPAALGYESIYEDIVTNGQPLSTAAIYGLIAGGNGAEASTQFPAWMATYPANGSGARPRTNLWAYDYFQVLLSAKMADAQGILGADTYLAAATARYIGILDGSVTGYDPLDDYQQIFVNAIAVELGIGTSYQAQVTWVEWNGSVGFEIQEAAYGLMGNSWSNTDVVKQYIKENICDFDYSEPVAEAFYAVGL